MLLEKKWFTVNKLRPVLCEPHIYVVIYLHAVNVKVNPHHD